jgi:RNA polymerase sigma factor (sigma-70 family)
MSDDNPERVNQLVDHLFRHESGKMVSVLTKMLGIENLDVAQDIVQDTLLKAMSIWRYGKLPDNPSAWLYTVARNKAIDFLRAQKSRRSAKEIPQAPDHIPEELFDESEIHDSLLRMVFACCHPLIAEESQVALALKTLCGLSVSEIAKAFITNEDTIAKRIYRAKEKIHSEKIALEVPHASQITTRIDSVHRVLYLMFNEGYNSSQPDQLIRKDICAESMRLCHLLTLQSSTNLPSTQALLALMCFQASRLDSRMDDQGHIITLKYQDRRRWSRQLIDKGNDYLDLATVREDVSAYHIEAGIAALHSFAPSFEQTDWKSVYDLYEALYSMRPSPIVALNKAIASSYALSNQSALEQLKKIKGLENHYLYHAALGEVFYQMNKKSEAKHHFEQAYQLTPSHAEKQFIDAKIKNC